MITKIFFNGCAKSGWFSEEGPEKDFVISTRTRLARNIAAKIFPIKAKERSRREILELVFNVAKNIPLLKDNHFIFLSDLNKLEKEFLVERHLISKDFISKESWCGLIFSNDERLSIMVNEEDHLRIQQIESGADLNNSFEKVNKIDMEFGEKLVYAYSPDYGYLTSCPTNLGTGMRISFLMHLPALFLRNEIRLVLENLSKLGIVARGFYGEGSKFIGDIMQISNSTTLAVKEQEVIEQLLRVVKSLIKTESQAREKLFQNNLRSKTEDLIYRAWGIITNVRSISFLEVINLISKIRLGLYLNMNLETNLKTLNELIFITQPAHIQLQNYGKELTTQQRDILRANLVREKIKGN